MTRPGPLPAGQVREGLQSLPGWSWSGEGGPLEREFRFEDFGAAFAFMTHCALIAEAMNHHPDWTNVWNRVEVRLHTHDAGGITELDLELARRMSAAAGG